MLANREQRALEMEAMEDRVLLAGSVDVTLDNGLLSVIGDASANSVVMTQLPNGQYLVLGLGTQVNFDGETEGVTQGNFGFSLTIDADLVEDVDVDLGEGFNSFVASGISTTDGDFDVVTSSGMDFVSLSNITSSERVSVDTGAGLDTVLMTNIQAEGNVRVFLGEGTNTAILTNVTAASNLRINGSETPTEADATSNSSNFILATGLNVAGNTDVFTGTGRDFVSLAGEFTGDLNVDLGAGSDIVGVNGNVDGDLDLIGGAGTDTGILLQSLTLAGAFTNAEFEFDFGFDINT